MKILAETFRAETVTAEKVGAHMAEYINGTVGIEFKGRTVTAYCKRHADGGISVLGFVGRYRTGAKLWRASVVMRKDGDTWVTFGRDERSGRCQKQNMVWYSPDEYFKGAAA